MFFVEFELMSVLKIYVRVYGLIIGLVRVGELLRLSLC